MASHIPPIAAGHRYLVFLTRRAPYVSFSALPWSTFVLAPDYGPEGAWVDPDGRILVDVTPTHIVLAGRRPDLVPQVHPRLRKRASDPVDVVPMAPADAVAALRQRAIALRDRIPEPAALPANFRPRRREGGR